jgi:hypothetical protein
MTWVKNRRVTRKPKKSGLDIEGKKAAKKAKKAARR